MLTINQTLFLFSSGIVFSNKVPLAYLSTSRHGMLVISIKVTMRALSLLVPPWLSHWLFKGRKIINIVSVISRWKFGIFWAFIVVLRTIGRFDGKDWKLVWILRWLYLLLNQLELIKLLRMFWLPWHKDLVYVIYKWSNNLRFGCFFTVICHPH